MDRLAERAMRILASSTGFESTGLRKSETPRLRGMRDLAFAAGLAAFVVAATAEASARGHSHSHSVRHSVVHAHAVSQGSGGATAQMTEAPSFQDVASRSGVVQAAKAAARATGCDAGFLAALSWEESRLGKVDRNRRSTAAGPFQFTDIGWLAAVRDHGAQHGLAREASSITQGRSGALYVSAKGRHAVGRLMALRENARLAAMMAAETIMATAPALEEAKGRPVDWADLYLGHVLGKTGAVGYIAAMRRHPSMPALVAAGTGGLPNKGLFVTADGENLNAKAAHDAIQSTLVKRSAEIQSMSVARSVQAEPVEVAEAPFARPRQHQLVAEHPGH
jgi:hypothetical protein